MEIQIALERIIPKIQRLEILQFSTKGGLHSIEQHDQIIAACRNREFEQVVRLNEENWLSLGELLIQFTDLG